MNIVDLTKEGKKNNNKNSHSEYHQESLLQAAASR